VAFQNQQSLRRRKIIFDALDNDKNFYETNLILKRSDEKTLNNLDYLTWKQFLFPISKKDIQSYKDIVEDGKDLSWVARKLKINFSKRTIS